MQKLIEEKATNKLKADLMQLTRDISNQPLLCEMSTGTIPRLALPHTPPEPQDKIYRPTQFFYIGPYDNLETDLGYMGQLYRYWLPTYIEKESQELLKKVDQITQDVAYLLDNKPQ